MFAYAHMAVKCDDTTCFLEMIFMPMMDWTLRVPYAMHFRTWMHCLTTTQNEHELKKLSSRCLLEKLSAYWHHSHKDSFMLCQSEATTDLMHKHERAGYAYRKRWFSPTHRGTPQYVFKWYQSFGADTGMSHCARVAGHKHFQNGTKVFTRWKRHADTRIRHISSYVSSKEITDHARSCARGRRTILWFFADLAAVWRSNMALWPVLQLLLRQSFWSFQKTFWSYHSVLPLFLSSRWALLLFCRCEAAQSLVRVDWVEVGKREMIASNDWMGSTCSGDVEWQYR